MNELGNKKCLRVLIRKSFVSFWPVAPQPLLAGRVDSFWPVVLPPFFVLLCGIAEKSLEKRRSFFCGAEGWYHWEGFYIGLVRGERGWHFHQGRRVLRHTSSSLPSVPPLRRYYSTLETVDADRVQHSGSINSTRGRRRYCPATSSTDIWGGCPNTAQPLLIHVLLLVLVTLFRPRTLKMPLSATASLPRALLFVLFVRCRLFPPRFFFAVSLFFVRYFVRVRTVSPRRNSKTPS